jgi:hypothetical protein
MGKIHFSVAARVTQSGSSRPAGVASVAVTVPPQGSWLRSRRGGPLRHGAASRTQVAFPAARRS